MHPVRPPEHCGYIALPCGYIRFNTKYSPYHVQLYYVVTLTTVKFKTVYTHVQTSYAIWEKCESPPNFDALVRFSRKITG